MILLCYGMTKSGSTLAFELVKAILEYHGHVQRRLPDGVVRPLHTVNFSNFQTPDDLTRLKAEVAAEEIIAIKVHGPLAPDTQAWLEAAIAEGSYRLHVNYRDPREVCLSLLDASEKARARDPDATRGFGIIQGWEAAAAFAQKQVQHCLAWAAVPGALHLYYNDVAFATEAVLDRMCAHLMLPLLSTTENAELRQQVFETAFTQRNKAVADRWRSDLTSAQNADLLARIEGATCFIERACEARDTEWLRTAARG